MVTVPLIMLAIPSLVIGYFTIDPMLFGDYFKGRHFHQCSNLHPAMAELGQEFHGAGAMALHALTTLPFWLAFSGVALSWFFYMKRPDIPAAIKERFSLIYTILENKYGFDTFNDWFFAGGARKLGNLLWRYGDVKLIDGFFVNGTRTWWAGSRGVIRHVPVRLHLPLRVCHDYRRVCLDHLVCRAADATVTNKYKGIGILC